MYPIIPHEKIAQCVAFTYADVLNKPRLRQSNTPHATTFCRYYFGTSRPKADLLTLIVSSKMSVPNKLQQLEAFLRSDGYCNLHITPFFAGFAFPHLVTRVAVNSSNRADMHYCRNHKVEDKQKQQQDRDIEQEIQRLLAKEVTPYAWATEFEQIPEYQILHGLRLWFDAYLKNALDYSFSDLYDLQFMTLSAIACDMQLTCNDLNINYLPPSGTER